MRHLLLTLAFVAGCGCATCANAIFEMTLEVQRPLCVDEFATEIANRCFVREC